MSSKTRQKLVVLSGAGISAESGLKTFRDSDGLWEGYNIEDVATPRAWRKDPQLVLEFYNMRRRNVREAEPNAAHKVLAELEGNCLPPLRQVPACGPRARPWARPTNP